MSQVPSMDPGVPEDWRRVVSDEQVWRALADVDPQVREAWRRVLTGENPDPWRKGWRLRRTIPAKHRCKNCNAPFDGIGAWVMRLVGRGQFNKNPRFCDY